MPESYSRDRASLRIRLPEKSETGEPFIKWLHRTAGRGAAKRQAIFLQQWDHQADHLGAAPSPKEYAEEWRESLTSTYRLLDEFRSVFPTERDPSRVMALLWSGTPRLDQPGAELMALLDVKVVGD